MKSFSRKKPSLKRSRVRNDHHPASVPFQVHEDQTQQVQRSLNCPCDGHCPRCSSKVGVMRSGGEPMSPGLQDYFESRFDRNFGDVRLHHDRQSASSANRLNARAYTIGHNITFGSGEFSPDSTEGRRLLAHELTHVVQQSAVATGNISSTGQRIQCWPPTTRGGSTTPRDIIRQRRTPASSMGEYISLVRSLESTYRELAPRQFLAMLRQIYYGRPWSSRPTTPF